MLREEKVVGIVVVAHSEELAKAVCEMALQMSLGKDVPIVPAGGLDEGGFGTSLSKIQTALDKVYGNDGVLVLMDLGSAVMTTQMLLEILPEEKRAKIILSKAPIVEGAIAAVVASAQGLDLEGVRLSAEKALSTPKIIEETPQPEVEEKVESEAPSLSVEVVVPNPVGLHARPASLFVQTASKFKSKIIIQNLAHNRPQVDAKSMMEVASAGTARQGEKICITAKGDDANEALSTLKELVESGFGEMEEASSEKRQTKLKTEEAKPKEEEIEQSEPATIQVENVSELLGIPASPGYALSPAYLFSPVSSRIEKKKIDNVQEEIERVEKAIRKAISQIEEIRKKVAETGDEKVAQIFDFHKMILEDNNLLSEIKDGISKEQINAEAVVEKVFDEWHSKFEKLDDPYMKLRALDIKDVATRLIGILTGNERVSISLITEPVILIAEDLSPSDTALLDREKVKGIATAFGGATSHTAILAKMWGIPAVVGLGKQILDILSNTVVALDGTSGKIFVNPTSEKRLELEKRQKEFETVEKEALSHTLEPAVTKDGKQVEVVANIGDVESAVDAVKFGAEGVGLLRTEVLYLERQSPPEEEVQFNFYKKIGETMGKRPLVIRTLDIGGDKPLPYLKIPKESNPFLGLRAIRLCLEQPQIFLTQVKAILRAGVGFNFKIMLPMISSIDEILQLKELIEKAKEELSNKGVSYVSNPEVGIMVEIPSAAILADKIIEHVDFFSIGSNDLTQYTLAVDRGNKSVSGFYQPFSPSLFRLFKMVIDAAHSLGKWTGLCGELAGQRGAVPGLLGLGLDEFSMSPRSIPSIKALIRQLSFGEAKPFAEELLNAKNAEEIKELTAEFFKNL
jgi:phosphoenolpyruvate-protein phosphotransferase/dihydroxyacetone kinase phosphotransfer subunit